MNHVYARKYKSTKTVFSEIQARSIQVMRIPRSAQAVDGALTALVDEMLKNRSEYRSKMEAAVNFVSSTYSIPPRVVESAFEGDGWASIQALFKLGPDQKEEAFSYFSLRAESLNAMEKRFQKLNDGVDGLVSDLYELNDDEKFLVGG